MFSTEAPGRTSLSRELPCLRCGHAPHSYLPCSDTCDCGPVEMPSAPALWLSRDTDIAAAA